MVALKYGDAGTLAARMLPLLLLLTLRSGDAGRRRSGRGKVRLAYGDVLLLLVEAPRTKYEVECDEVRGVISSSASSDMLLISGESSDGAPPPSRPRLEWVSSTEDVRNGLRTRLGERRGLEERGADGERVGEKKIGEEWARVMGGALDAEPVLLVESGRAGVSVMLGREMTGCWSIFMGDTRGERCKSESEDERGVSGR